MLCARKKAKSPLTSHKTDTAVSLLAPAKVNLTLHVTGQRDDGYHTLDSLVAFATLGDTVTIASAQETTLQVTGALAKDIPADARNLMWKAAEQAGVPLEMTLQKMLPAAAGIGGGSSDAAAVLRGLVQMGHAVPETVGLSLGADVPVCMAATGARMSGIGEHVSVTPLPDLPALLVNPMVSVPTGAVFNAMMDKNNPPMADVIPEFSDVSHCASWLADQRNDMQAAAIAQEPVIERALQDLSATKNVLLTRMSGSGATCFALYPTIKAAHFAAYEFGAEHTDWWVRATVLS